MRRTELDRRAPHWTVHNPEVAFRSLLLELAQVFRAEGRPGGTAAAEAYERAAESPFMLVQQPFYRLDHEIRAAFARARHPAARAARVAHPCLRWSAASIPEEQIPARVSNVFAVVSLIGPGAMFESEAVRSGLFVQVANAYYPPHAHAAEETYVMLAGQGEWTLDHRRPLRRRTGDYIHHPPGVGHATRTGPRPLLAAWRWSGDIGLESYRLLEEHA